MDDSGQLQVPTRSRLARVTIALVLVSLSAVGAVACGASGNSRCPDANLSTPGSPSPTSATTGIATTSATAADGSFPFPVAVSTNGRYLVDQDGAPFMIVGDSPQCLSAHLTTQDMDFFFANRQKRGFNTAWVNLICGTYTWGVSDARTCDGITPFVSDGDLSTPNPDYFARMDAMVQIAARHGITLLLNPAETGSFRDLLKDNGTDKSRDYGIFVGERYKDAPNIIWMLGNDYQIDQWATYDPFEIALSQGIRAADPQQLQTVELNPPVSTSFDDPSWPPLIDIASAYSYTPTYDVVLKAYNASPTQPVLMIEANFEDENNDGGPPTSDLTLRNQEWWTALTGAAGQLYGNKYTWGMNNSNWIEHLDTKAVTELGFVVQFLKDRPWQDLVPDQAHTFLTGDMGTYTSTGDVLENDYATAAVTADRTLAIAYTPIERTLTIDETTLPAGATAQWFDPTDGSYRPASAPFTTPGKNAAGDGDWVLIFEAPSS
jgi:Protein of unknown function (DUF4038)/Putative collagen-binding domain of a collagenase